MKVPVSETERDTLTAGVTATLLRHDHSCYLGRAAEVAPPCGPTGCASG